MAERWITKPKTETNYVLGNVRIPPALCKLTPEANGWCNADVFIRNGHISGVEKHSSIVASGIEVLDADQSILMSALVDCHTHLDKAHVAAFANFQASDLREAIDAMKHNKQTWTAENLAARVEYSLQTAFANGTRAMRSHVDFATDGPSFVWDVMQNTVDRWRGKIDIQLLPLAGITALEDPDFLAAYYAKSGTYGRIGIFVFDQPDLLPRLSPIFEYANAQGWDIDLHVDEGLDPKLNGLLVVAEVAIATGFNGRLLCGHCVALGNYDRVRQEQVIARCAKAGLHFVALPTTNLFLQGREPQATENLRGMAPVAKLIESGAVVSMGADNVRDGFSAFGDFDPMAILNLGSLVGHLHNPARDWATLITTNPAESMGLAWNGVIEVGAPADLVLFSGRDSYETALSFSPERVVIRGGRWSNATVPDVRILSKGI